MNRDSFEIITLTINALGAGILMFVAGVVQPLMNAMDASQFRTFLNDLNRCAMRSSVAVTVVTLPVVAAVIYWPIFGFDHWWFTAGLATWLIGSSMTKVVNLPVYKWASHPGSIEPEKSQGQRKRLQTGNVARAWLTFLSVVLMACQFQALDVLIALGVSVVISVPMTLWARRSAN